MITTTDSATTACKQQQEPEVRQVNRSLHFQTIARTFKALLNLDQRNLLVTYNVSLCLLSQYKTLIIIYCFYSKKVADYIFTY